MAAARVADNNPNFTFDELRARMLDGDGMTLGAAIHALEGKRLRSCGEVEKRAS